MLLEILKNRLNLCDIIICKDIVYIYHHYVMLPIHMLCP